MGNASALSQRRRMAAWWPQAPLSWGDEGLHPNGPNWNGVLACVDVGAFPAGDSAFGRRHGRHVWDGPWTRSIRSGRRGGLSLPRILRPLVWRPPVLKGGAWATRSRLAYNTIGISFGRLAWTFYQGFVPAPDEAWSDVQGQRHLQCAAGDVRAAIAQAAKDTVSM